MQFLLTIAIFITFGINLNFIEITINSDNANETFLNQVKKFKKSKSDSSFDRIVTPDVNEVTSL